MAMVWGPDGAKSSESYLPLFCWDMPKLPRAKESPLESGGEGSCLLKRPGREFAGLYSIIDWGFLRGGVAATAKARSGPRAAY